MIVRLSFVDREDRPVPAPVGAPAAMELPMPPPVGMFVRFLTSTWAVRTADLVVGREVSAEVVLHGPILLHAGTGPG